MNSRAKGCRGEREFRDVLRAAGYEARRGQQFAGGGDSPDVVCESLPSIHWEVKRCQRGRLYDWLGQANLDARNGPHPLKTPIVAHKRNGAQWVAILAMDDLLEIIRRSDLPK